MEIPEQNEAQFRSLHGKVEKQSKTTKASFQIIFNNMDRGLASEEFEVSEQAISMFIKNNERKHNEFHYYINK